MPPNKILCYTGTMAQKENESGKRESNLKLFRIHQIDAEIRSGSYPNKVSLSQKLEVSERTIARDLDYLRDFYKAPIEFDVIRNGFYYTEADFFIKYVNLTEGELFSLSLFDRLLTQYKNTPLESQLKTIFAKITSGLPDKVQFDSQFLSNEITYVSEPLPQIDSEIFKTIMKALQSHTRVKICHKPLTHDKTERQIDPYHIVCKAGSWYVLAFCHLKNQVRIFSLARIKSAQLTGEHFAVPKDFKLSDYIDPSFGIWASEQKKYTIKIRCSDLLAKSALEQKWHEKQTTTQNPDGTVDVCFETTQLHESMLLAMNLGANAKVLEPPELIELVQKQCEGILRNYR